MGLSKPLKGVEKGKMKKFIFFTLLTLYASICIHAQNTASQTVFDFESGNIDDWTLINVQGEIGITSEDKYSGQYAVKLVADSTCKDYWDIQLETPEIDVNAGHAYRISFWAKSVEGDGTIRLSTADSSQLVAGADGAARQYLPDQSISSEWTQYTYETVYGSGLIAGGSVLQLCIDAGKVANRTYYVDDIAIEDLSPVDTTGDGPLAKDHEKFLGNIVDYSIPAYFDLYWNQITPENSGKWGSVEPQQGTMNLTALSNAYNYAKSKGYKFKYHTLVWGSQEPTWLGALSQDDQKAAMDNFMKTIAANYPDIDYIDVVNEPLHTPSNIREALGGNGSTGWDWVVWSFQKARDYFPKSKLLINEYGIISDVNEARSYIGIINILKDRNLIDGIGIQCHEFNLNDVPVSTMKTVLDTLGATGLPIYVSELDISGDPAGDEDSQYQIYQQKFPVLWEHESVAGITLWGYITGLTWKTGTGIVDPNGHEREAMVWLKEYMASDESKVPNKFEDLTSLKTVSLSADVEVYPNPATSYVVVKGNGIKRVDIYDILGKRLMTQHNDGTINIAPLGKGIYLLRIETESGTTEKKILKK